MAPRSRHLVRRHCLIPLIVPTMDFCNLKGFATRLRDPHMDEVQSAR